MSHNYHFTQTGGGAFIWIRGGAIKRNICNTKINETYGNERVNEEQNHRCNIEHIAI